jgi:catecholate siderophore receptor
MVTKTPSLRSAYAATFAYASGNQSRSTLDINQPLSSGPPMSWLSRAAARLNGFWQKGGVAGRDSVEVDNRSIAPAISLGIGTPTRVIYSGQFTRNDNLPDYGIPTAAWLDEQLGPNVTPATSPVRQANYYGSVDYDFDHVSQDSHTARIERDLNANFTLTNQTRYNKTYRNAIVTGLSAFSPATETVAVSRQGNERQNRIASNQTNVTGRFSLARLRHALTAGTEYTYEDQVAPGITGVGTRPAVSIYSPNTLEPVSAYAPSRSGALTKGWTNTIAMYAFDTTSIGERWQLSGGIRWERYTTNFRSIPASGPATVEERGSDGLLSGKGGVLFRVTESANVYFSYGTSVTPPGTANFTLSAQANNQNSPNVEPQRSRNYEVGGKWDVFGRRLSLAAAAFDTRNENVIFTVDASATPPIFNQDDGQHVRGLTLSATGYITPRINILASLGYLDSELETQNAANDGNRLALTPPRSASLWGTFLLPRNVTVGGGLRYTDTVNVNAANTIKSPGYTVADMVVDYPVHRTLSLRLNVNNLTNASYVRNVNNNGNRYNPGIPRSFMVTSSVKF